MKYAFGDKIRKVRQEKSLTLKELALSTGVSESMISQIERDLVSPAIETLIKIAEALDIDFDYLFSELRKKRKAHVVKAAARNTMVRSGVRYEQLSKIEDEEIESGIGSYYLEIDSGCSGGARDIGHIGNELGVILEGQALFEYGDEIYTLHQGDSISFAADVPHVLKNDGDSVLKAFWVVTPPKMIFGKES